MLAGIVGIVFASCQFRGVPGSAGMSGSAILSVLVISICAMVALSERSTLKRLHLRAAERQDGRPSLDGFKDLADLVREPLGRQFLLVLLLFVVLVFGGMAAWKPILGTLSKVLPPSSCLKLDTVFAKPGRR